MSLIIPIEVFEPPAALRIETDVSTANPGQTVQLLVRDVDTDAAIPGAAVSLVRGGGGVLSPQTTGNDGRSALNITGAPGIYVVQANVGDLTATVTIQVVEPGYLPEQALQAFKVGDVVAAPSVQPENFRTFDQLVSSAASAIQVRARQAMDLTEGSVLLALIEAVAGAIGLFGQAQVAELLAKMRAVTAAGADLDSWMADFGVARQPAVPATGLVTFSRATTTAAASIPVGAAVGTAQNSALYAVVADTAHPAYGAGAYLMAVGVGSLSVPVQCTSAGLSGNALAGTVNKIGSPLPGVDAVSNASSFVNGADTASDDALRQYFRDWLAGLSKANADALRSAIDGVSPTARFALVEGQTYDTGVSSPGYFYIVIDDGSGSPSSEFLSRVRAAVDAVRPLGIPHWDLQPPVAVTANVALSITVESGVDAAIQSYLSTLNIGQSLPYTRIAQIAYDASDSVLTVTGITINGGVSDLSATVKQAIRPGTVTVS